MRAKRVRFEDLTGSDSALHEWLRWEYRNAKAACQAAMNEWNSQKVFVAVGRMEAYKKTMNYLLRAVAIELEIRKRRKDGKVEFSQGDNDGQVIQEPEEVVEEKFSSGKLFG